jgi:hypothetical protein
MRSQIQGSSPAQVNATVIKIGMVSKRDLPDAWKYAITTPSLFGETSDSNVCRLESTDKGRVETRNLRPGDRKGLISPFQKLQRAAAMRRQRIAEGLIQESGNIEQLAAQPDLGTTPLPKAGRLGESSQSQDQGQDEGWSTLGMEVEKLPPEDDRDISDRDVLRGLRIICSASVDAEFDALVRSKTGLRLRRFLADLQSFEELSQVGMAS